MASVTFDGVCKTYPNGHRALSDFSLSVDDSELVVLVGPSGCGKSTLLRLLAGLEQPEHGSIRIGKRIVNALSPQQRNIAMVFQDYALYPTMTVRENLEFPLKMRKLDRAARQRRIARTADLLDLGNLLDRLPKQLSGGQRQRVAMGRALVREPSVFLLDEPLSNLDAKLRLQVRTEIVDIQRRTGTTMIYVTHDQVEAMTMSHRIAVLHMGRLQQLGTPRELYEHPSNTFVAGFIGTPPMNFLPAELLLRWRVQVPPVNPSAWGPTSGIEDAAAAPPTARTAGIRPENFCIVGTPAGFKAEVVQVEYLGHENLLHLRVADAEGTLLAAPTFLLRTDGVTEVERGQSVNVGIRANGIRWFDAEGVALLPTAGY